MESKQQLNVCKHTGSPPLKKFHVVPSPRKEMLTFFFFYLKVLIYSTGYLKSKQWNNAAKRLKMLYGMQLGGKKPIS